MLPLYFAPLQGYTTATYRRLHHCCWGGIDAYYTPFVRIEKGGFRNKDIADIAAENNRFTPTIPQILPRNAEELHTITQLLREQQYTHANINMGCPFPPIALHRRGSGLLPYPQEIATLLRATEKIHDMEFSIKMRLGWQENNEWEKSIEILNDTPLKHIIIHPRIGKQQYKGNIDYAAFEAFYNKCTHPIIYNGDIQSIDDIKNITQRFPRLAGIMIGRGLLARPYLPLLLDEKRTIDAHHIIARTQEFHQELYAHLEITSQGNTQLLQRSQDIWKYFLPHTSHKHRKAILKATSPIRYQQAVRQLFDAWTQENNPTL